MHNDPHVGLPQTPDSSLKAILKIFSNSFYDVSVKTAEENVSHTFIDDIRDDIVNNGFEDISHNLAMLHEGVVALALGSAGTRINEDFIDFMKNYHIFEINIEKKIRSLEGFVCVCDKSRTVMEVIARYLLTGERTDFNYEAEYTFHYPKKVFTTFEEIIQAYEKINSFINGHIDF